MTFENNGSLYNGLSEVSSPWVQLAPRVMKCHLQGLFHAPECNFRQWRARFSFSFTDGPKKMPKLGHF